MTQDKMEAPQTTHQHITNQQLQEWKDAGNKEKLQEANEAANACVICQRTWLFFWGDQQ